MTDWRKRDILSDAIARYNRGEISREQYLEQEKALLMKEKAEQQAIHEGAQKRIDSISVQIAEIESELLSLETENN